MFSFFYNAWNKLSVSVYDLVKFFTKSNICDICYETKYNFSNCPQFIDHKWCESCDLEIGYKCPFCRSKFKKIMICPTSSLDQIYEPIYINVKDNDDQ